MPAARRLVTQVRTARLRGGGACDPRSRACPPRRPAALGPLRYDSPLSASRTPRPQRPEPMNAPLPMKDLADAANQDTAAPRLREIPYNYTSFSDREIVHPPARRPRLGSARPPARRAPHRPLGAHAVRSAGRHLGGAAQPLPAGRPARQPQAPRAADRGAAPPPGRDREAAHAATSMRRATPLVGELLDAARKAVGSLRRASSEAWPTCAGARRASLGRHTAQATTSSSTACRASRT